MERNREFCHNLLKEYTQNESLLKHAYSVEACVRSYAQKFNEDTEFWGNVALLHDFDYEKFPTMEEHPFQGEKILKEKGFSEVFTRAILSHADHANVKRESLLEKVLYACDELSGFITAVTLVRPNKKIDEVEVSSVKKKMKDKAFAKAVSRDDIKNGADDLGISLDEHIQFCISAMRGIKENLGL
ncbi:MAG: HDIG domain-containing protein [Ignavibacteriae bacterium]|nr:HDIG domain-containing protein [Ignavibacteriota bacterium]